MYGRFDSKPLFLKSLEAGALVFDGATGTELYERGAYFDKPFEELCLTKPALVGQIHQDYLQAGADVLKTNTFGANEFVLKRFGLEAKVVEICKKGVQLAKEIAQDRAFVAGVVGPTGLLSKDLIRSSSRKEAFDAFRKSAVALYEAGADLLLFETFCYVGELEIAIEAAYGLPVPIIGQVAFNESFASKDGATPLEVAKRLSKTGVDAVGANCILGPEEIYNVAKEMLLEDKPVILQPNVGFPKKIEGRSIYQTSPETFGVCARRAFKLGVSGFGGCCGTNPQYIKRVVAAAKMFGKKEKPSNVEKKVIFTGFNRLEKTTKKTASRSLLAQKLANKEKVISIEFVPPVGISLAQTISKLKEIEAFGIQFVNVPDGPRAMVRMSNLAFCKKVLEETKLEPILHVCGRDRNLLALQANFLGAYTLGIKNAVIVTGDPPKIGDYPDATAVFDLDSIGMLSLASHLNVGIDPGGKAIGEETALVLVTGAEPNAANFDREIDRLKKKIDAGAEAVMTQPVYDARVFERFLNAISGFNLPVIMGILPLASSRNAVFLHEKVPGMQIPEKILKEIVQCKTREEAVEFGINVSVRALVQIKKQVQGVYLMPPLGRVSSCLEVVRRSEIMATT